MKTLAELEFELQAIREQLEQFSAEFEKRVLENEDVKAIENEVIEIQERYFAKCDELFEIEKQNSNAFQTLWAKFESLYSEYQDLYGREPSESANSEDSEMLSIFGSNKIPSEN